MKKLFIVIIFILFCFSDYSQTVLVQGNVYAFKNLSLNNITVKAKKTNTSVTTDLNGNFSILCNSKERIKFSGKGFQTKSIKCNGKNQLSVKLIFKGGFRNEKLAISGKHVRENDLLKAINLYSSYNGDNIEKHPLDFLHHKEDQSKVMIPQYLNTDPFAMRDNSYFKSKK